MSLGIRLCPRNGTASRSRDSGSRWACPIDVDVGVLRCRTSTQAAVIRGIGIRLERTGSRYEPRTMRLFLWSRHLLIELRSRDDGSLARYSASTGDLRVMRL